MTDIEFVSKPTATLVQTNASDEMVAMAAWVSFDRDSEERLEDKDRMKGLINFLMREKHMSPFEHGSFTFKIDCPIFVAREFHRHRTMAYNEVSGRYTEMKPRFYIPANPRPVVQKGKAGKYHFEQNETLLYRSVGHIAASTSVAWDHYEKMLEEGVAKEVARMALPNNLMTQFYATVNPRNLMHFLGLRTSEQALYEIRLVAEQMEDALCTAMPMTYHAWKKNEFGQVIGYMSDAGVSTGPHITFSNGDFISSSGANLTLSKNE